MRHLIVFLLLLVPVCFFGQTDKDSISREMKLPEVTVKMKPIRQVGDTLNYNVSSFRGKDDHYLVDVLKKLPGIEVSENGTVLILRGKTCSATVITRPREICPLTRWRKYR